MSIFETKTIDFVIVSQDHIALIILDAIEWSENLDDKENLYLIQENINTCLAYFETGQLRRDHPVHPDFPVKIVLVPVYPLGELGEWFFKKSQPVVEQAGLELIVDPDYALDEQ